MKVEKAKLKQYFGYLCKIGIPIAVGVGLFYWLFDNVDIDRMKDALRNDVDYAWIGVMLVVSIFR